MSDRPEVHLHEHWFPQGGPPSKGTTHRHAHPHDESHPVPVNEAHPQPYHFLCKDCEPHRYEVARKRAEAAIEGEFTP